MNSMHKIDEKVLAAIACIQAALKMVPRTYCWAKGVLGSLDGGQPQIWIGKKPHMFQMNMGIVTMFLEWYFEIQHELSTPPASWEP